MDVQTENMDPPPGESQPSGKIRKGFKLFGKRKPGNIFSIRSKGDGNSKSPVIRSNTLDGLSENAAIDSEQDPDKGAEVSQGETEQADEEPLSEDDGVHGVLAASPPRTSISSACSAKSLSFLSILRGGRRGMGDRRVHTVSQPAGRQRRGLKGLFGSVKFRSKDKEDKEDIPPSPLLMSSRANSVEIIKEDLTLTPKSQPRSLESPETESSEKSPDRDATPPPENTTTGKVSSSDEPASEAPLLPGDTSLSSLLADISSLLTFDSISGGKDIMADVEAEWGKASSAISAVVSEVPSSSTSLFSKPTMSSPLTSTSVSAAATVKPYSVAASTTVPSQSFTPLTKSPLPSLPSSKQSTIIQTPPASSTLTPNSLKMCLGSSASSTNTENKSDSFTATAKISTTAVTLTSFSASMMSSSSITIKSTQSSTSAPPNAPATIKASLTTPPLTSMAGKVASEIAAPPTTIDSVSNPNFVATLPLASAKPPVTHSPPSLITAAKLDSGNSLKSSSAGDFKAPVTVTPTCTVTPKPSCPPPVITTKVTTFTAVTSSSMAITKPTLPLSPVDQYKTSPLLVTAPDLCPQPSHASVSAPSSTSSDRASATMKSNPVAVSVDKIAPAPTHTAAPSADAFVPTGPPTPSALGHSAKAPTARTPIPISVCKETPATTQIPNSVPKDGPAPAQILVNVSKDAPLSAKIPVSHSKASPVPTLAPVSFLETSPPSPTAPWPSELTVAAMTRGSGQVRVDGQLIDPSSTPGGITGAKTEELNSESRTIHQFASKERKTAQVKASGLSKIPVVGGGRPVKQSVRESQHVDHEPSRDPPTPVLEEERHFNSHNAGRSKDQVSDVEANASTLIHTQEEEDQQPPQPKVLTSLPRDSKIPVKHGTQSHTASQIPQPSRTKIPVSKVPVRRAAHKAAVTGSSAQIRK